MGSVLAIIATPAALAFAIVALALMRRNSSLRVAAINHEHATARANERANVAERERNRDREAMRLELDDLGRQLERYREFYLEILPDTPAGRQLAADELDHQLDRMRRLLQEAEAGNADDADLGNGSQLP